MTTPSGLPWAPRALSSLAAGTLAIAALATAVSFGLNGLAGVGSDRWIEASYGVPAMPPAGPQVRVGLAASTTEVPSKLIVGDEQQWLAEPRVPTQKTLSTNAAGFALGDRVIFSVTPKGEARGLARTFEVVGIELLAGQPAADHAPQVLIAREIDASGNVSGKPVTLRLLVSDGEALPANKSL